MSFIIAAGHTWSPYTDMRIFFFRLDELLFRFLINIQKQRINISFKRNNNSVRRNNISLKLKNNSLKRN